MTDPFKKFLDINKKITSVRYTTNLLKDIRKNIIERKVELEGLSGTTSDSSNFVVYVPQNMNPDGFFLIEQGNSSGQLVIPRNERVEDIMKIRLVGMPVQIPELYFLINPESITVNQEKSYTDYYTRSGPKTEWNGNKPAELSLTGKSGGFYSVQESPEDNLGYGVRNYFKTLAFKNIMSIVSMYKNNGFIYGETSSSTGSMSQKNSVVGMGKAEILYKHKIYQGSFTSMSLSFQDANPAFLTFDFNFRAFVEIDSRPIF
jgi:hypothetical protein